MGTAAKPLKKGDIKGWVVLDSNITAHYVEDRYFWVDEFMARTIVHDFKFELLKTKKGDRLFIPIYQDGVLVSYTARAMDGQEPKYYSGPNGGPAGVLYDPLSTRTNSTVVLVEGPLDCVPFWNTPYRPIAVLGSGTPKAPGMHQAQIENLPKGVPIVVMLDRDKLGDAAILCGRIWSQGWKTILASHLLNWDYQKKRWHDPGSLEPSELTAKIELVMEAS